MMSLKVRKANALRAAMTKTPLKEVRESRNPVDRLDTKSDMSDMIANYQMENTYKLEPDKEKRFNHKKVEDIMKATLQEFLEGEEYEKTLGSRMSKMLADTIKLRVKELKWTRFKLVTQVVIGQKHEQDLRVGSRFLWNDKTDCYACANYSNKTLFAIAVCFGVYFD